MVPALIESKSGEIAYGLSVDNFSIKDNGIEQQVDVESDAGRPAAFAAFGYTNWP